MNLPLFIGLRYTRARRRNHFISFISTTSMAGVALGVWALITVMSVMNGFHADLRERILFVVSHVTISGQGGQLRDWRGVSRRAAEHSQVRAQAPFILGQGMLTRGGATAGVLIRGISPEREREVSQVLEHITEGEAALVPGEFEIILGATLARSLGVFVGDKVTLVAPKGRVTPAGFLPRLKRFRVKGLFQIDMHQYDSGIALVHIEDAAKLFLPGGGGSDRVSGLRLKLADVDSAPRVRRDLAGALGGGYAVRDWSMEHANFFRALEIEKRVVFIVLLLIIAVAAFNIVSTLVMAVTDKQADIAILRTLGMSPAGVMRVFVVQGVFIGVAGTIIGGALGVLTALNIETIIPALENFFNTELFPVDVYVITDFPAQMRWSDVSRVIGAALAMSFLATLYPAWRASRVEPAEALRYE
ncbi:MAG: Lipoprotein-releasing system transmembrane protein LolC [Arenicellales bacterium IbO2]|nr:lipoprotein-releasing ABC transporter permease subunit [Gammaproteobacteria bacterium]MDA8023654.1 lipoprotein-releasing ABC transporter permease subunit [Gammaproteobacteria bacterium]CAJ2376563.1 MAG: Lipoprotein-releasing system transmembrane protein LolC [Arenicellales bacterium IbO2]